MAVKQATIERKVERVRQSLDAIERGRYHDLSIDSCVDTIDWLWRFRYISKECKNSLCDKAIEAMEASRYY